MLYIKNPNKIEERSFEIIQQIIDEMRPDYEYKNKAEELIIKRCIHTTADFDYLDILKISDNAVEAIVEGLNQGATLYTDTTMALSGINKKILDSLGCKYKCLVSDERVVKISKEKGITRSMAAVEVALKEDGKKIFVFGNAPTALFRAIELSSNREDIIAIVGVPVGFVGASESKDELIKSDLNYIASKGRKGGSNLAAAIINAVLYHFFK